MWFWGFSKYLISENLTALGLPTGKTTVMHLVPRESLPEPNSQGNYKLNISIKWSDFYKIKNEMNWNTHYQTFFYYSRWWK